MSHEIIELVLSWVVSTTLNFTVVILDERRILNEEQLERAWRPTSRDAAIVAFGGLALPIHFMKTRGHFKSAKGILGIFVGLLLGIVVLVIVSLLTSVIVYGIEKVAGLPAEW